MKISSFKKVSFRRAILPASIIAAMAMSGSASAFKIDVNNEDIDMRWDNTFRYNAGWRMQDPSYDLIAPTSATSASEYRFKEKGGMVTNRLDILSEFDFIYKKSHGFRVSAAGWYDHRYQNDTLRGAPTSGVAFPGGKYPDEIQRYYAGPSGEFLDAFVFTKFDLGNVPVNVKLGQHTIYWGETLFSLGDGVSAGQSYADLRKAVATPGVEAKEVFKPLNQFSFSAQITPEFTVMGQYFLDWKPDLFPLGGTYFSPVDFLTYQGTTIVDPRPAPFYTIWDGVHDNDLDKSGDWGLAAKVRPEWLDGTAGFYFREYTPKNGGALGLDPTTSLTGGPTTAALYIDAGAPRTKLYGFSLAKQVWGISWGLDLTYRDDATLLTKPFAYTIGTGWAPIGEVYTGTFNMIAYDGKRAIYDSAVLTAELAFDGLVKVTKNAQNFGGRANCTSGTAPADLSSFLGLPAGTVIAPTPNGGAPNQGYYGCATGQSYGISFLFEPKWFQVFPGTDVTMPMFYTVGLKGNSPVPAVGQNEGMGVYSIGVAADVDAKYNFALKYNGQLYKRGQNSATGAPFSNAALGDFSDRNWISFTAKATW